MLFIHTHVYVRVYKYMKFIICGEARHFHLTVTVIMKLSTQGRPQKEKVLKTPN